MVSPTEQTRVEVDEAIDPDGPPGQAADPTEQTGVMDPLSLRDIGGGLGTYHSRSMSASDGPGVTERLAALVDNLEPTRLDRYALIELVGRGSFGSVWAAYDPQLDRRVAIKVMYLRKRDEESRLRALLNEAQMLAQVNHPNVVAIHDVQMLDGSELGGGGQRGLYIVMEFLGGETLGEWMRLPEEETRDWAEVLEVFCQAGRGLAAAHAKGLVHRDFKPANTMFGNDGRIRVLDFGLARTQQNPRPGKSKSERVTGTPAYMSPEQHLGEPADARSDQFSFCVALYEALYGQRPFLGKTTKELGHAKIASEIQSPPRTSKVPARLFNVIRRGLSMEPHERFPSMDALIKALLDDPVARRRRWIGASLAVVLVAGLGYGAAKFQEADEPVCEVDDSAFEGIWDEQIRGQVRQQFAESDVEFAEETLTRVEEGIDNWTASWVAVHNQACDRARAKGKTLEADDEVRLCLDRTRRRLAGLTAILVDSDGQMISRASETVVQLPRVDSCLDAGSSVQASTDVDPARRDSLLEVEGELARADALFGLGRYEDALEVAKAAEERALEVEDYSGASRAAWLQAQTHHLYDRPEEALATSRRSSGYAAQADDPDRVTYALIQQVTFLSEGGKTEGAESLAAFVQAYALDDELSPELRVRRDYALGRFEYWRNDSNKARELFSAAVEQARADLGEKHQLLADAYVGLGMAWARDEGAEDKVTENYTRALALQRELYGDHHPAVASTLNNLASHYARSGQLEKARKDFAEVVELTEAIFGEDAIRVAPTLMNLALIDVDRGQWKDALVNQERALKIGVAGFPAESQYLGRFYELRADILRHLDRRDAALEDLRAALANKEHNYGPAAPDTALVMSRLGQLLREMGRVEEAERFETVALASLERELPDGTGSLGVALEQLARIHYVRGDYERSRGWAQKAVEHQEKTKGSSNPKTALARAALMRALVALDRADEAIALGTKARDQLDPETEAVVGLWKLHLAMSKAQAAAGYREAAVAALERAVEMLEAEQGQAETKAELAERLAELRK